MTVYMTCRATGKRCYPSQREAGSVINAARKRHRRRSRADAVPRRAYHCTDCGQYHLTKLREWHDRTK